MAKSPPTPTRSSLPRPAPRCLLSVSAHGYAAAALLALTSANGCRSTGPPQAESAPAPSNRPSEATPAPAASTSWTDAFDFDGDGQADEVLVSFSGGAHCCYRLAVKLTSTGVTYRLPFNIDGGYRGGLDLRYRDRFDVRRTDGELPELVMEIETYNGEPMLLPLSWIEQYGFHTHYIAVGFPKGRIRVRDWPPPDAGPSAD